MRPDPRFARQPKSFWAHVRTLSQEIGYTDRSTGSIRVYSESEIKSALSSLGLGYDHLFDRGGPSYEGLQLLSYFEYRADRLNTVVQHNLMDAEAAVELFQSLHDRFSPRCPIPMNKQKGEKKRPALLTGMVNMLVEQGVGGLSVDYDPRELTTFTQHGRPLRTLARRVDGCFPSAINPVALWEIKEYYYTTTFGSRVADGVYETLLDGLELEELREHEGVHADHVLFVDSHFTWWVCGRSYLCRMMDILNMGYVGEIFFGRELITEFPVRIEQWVQEFNRRQALG